MILEGHFSWQAGALVEEISNCHLSWQVHYVSLCHYVAKFNCHFLWQVHSLIISYGEVLPSLFVAGALFDLAQ